MWQIASALTRKLPAEMAHNVAVKALSYGVGPSVKCPSLPVMIAGLSCDNPLGLAAGFDKNAEAYDGAFQLGFGMVEVGTITPLPQPGNPRPRVFRLPEDEAVINRYGFNGHGMDAAKKRLQKRKAKEGQILGVNIGANKLTEHKPDDYHKAAAALASLADYLTVNISSPNTPGLRDLQDEKGLADTLDATFAGLKEADGNQSGTTRPVFVKLAPDLTSSALHQSMEAAMRYPIAGFILTNTTIQRPDDLRSSYKDEQGGLSGRPVAQLSEQALINALAFKATHGSDFALISVGGIFDAKDVFVRLALGADATQLYSALSLSGPDLPARILHELHHMLAIANIPDIASLRGAHKQAGDAHRQASDLYHSALAGGVM